MKKEQPELPGMPPERTLDGQIIPKWSTAWFVVAHATKERYLAQSRVTGNYSLMAGTPTDPDVVYFNSKAGAQQAADNIPGSKVVRLSWEVAAECGLK